MLDLFCGQWGWSKVFAARGWECVGIDLQVPSEVPRGCTFIKADVLDIAWRPALTSAMEDQSWFWVGHMELFSPDFICASPPCEQFSVHGMRHFYPDPAYPELGIKLFTHTKSICGASGVPYVIENVRPAQKFIGKAAHHCGPYYLWGTGVPPLMPQGVEKNHAAPGMTGGWLSGTQVKALSPQERKAYRDKCEWGKLGGGSKARKAATARVATIPAELANCVANYAERLINGNS